MATQKMVYGEAPGRIDFMGGVADYSGSLVLEMPIRATTRVTIHRIPEKILRLESDQNGRTKIDFSLFHHALGRRASEEELRLLLDSARLPHWARYPIGCLLIFCRETDWRTEGGLAFEIKSTVPQSMGVSSSAALEIATLRALGKLAKRKFQGTLLARLGQRAENRMVGAPCGLMDQLACAYGRPGHLLPIWCRPDKLDQPVKLPEGIFVVGWPSGVKHSVSASPYARARAAAFMGKKILEMRLHRRWEYAAQITPAFFRNQAEAILPEIMNGRKFLSAYKFIDDPISKIDSRENYPVHAALQFPVEENDRCRIAANLLRRAKSGDKETVLRKAGELMGRSHDGYSAMGLGSPETDQMADALMEVGPERGIYGARVSGGGSGGAVVVLLKKVALPILKGLARKIHFSETGPLPLIY